MTTRVGINGFGRIGRNFFRAAKERGADLEFVAANDLGSVELMAHLLKYDSILGTFDADIEVVGDGIKVDGDTIAILAERDPAALPWGELGVDVVVESTGLFTERDKAAKHLDAGAPIVDHLGAGQGRRRNVRGGRERRHVRPRAPQGRLERLVHHELLRPDGQGPRRRLRHREGLDDDGPRLHRTQALVDGPASRICARRGRPRSTSIPSSTGAARATGMVLEAMKGGWTGSRMRVPVPDGSITDFTALLAAR